MRNNQITFADRQFLIAGNNTTIWEGKWNQKTGADKSVNWQAATGLSGSENLDLITPTPINSKGLQQRMVAKKGRCGIHLMEKNGRSRISLFRPFL